MCLPEDISYQIFSSLKPNLWTFIPFQVGVLERGRGDTLDFVSFTTRWSGVHILYVKVMKPKGIARIGKVYRKTLL